MITTFPVPDCNLSCPDGITAGPGGNLWFTSQQNDWIARITTDGAITTFRDPAGNVHGPLGITTGPDTNMWFTSTINDRIGRIATTGPPPEPPPAPPEPVVVAPRFTG